MEEAAGGDALPEYKVGKDGKRRRKRTAAEKEARRKQKEAEAAGEADGPQVLQVNGPRNSVGRPASAASNASNVSSRPRTADGRPGSSNALRAPTPQAARGPPVATSAWGGEGVGGGDVEQGGGGEGNADKRSLVRALTMPPPDENEAVPPFVSPSYAEAMKHAKRVNVYRQRAGIAVRMNDDALMGLSGDEILADIFGECEKRGLILHTVNKDGKASAVIEDVPPSHAADLAQFGVTVRGVRVRCVPEETPPAQGVKASGDEDELEDLARPYVWAKTGPSELGELGVGIGLYFESLLWGAKVLGCLTFLGFFTILVYVQAGSGEAQLEAGALTGFALPTLGAVSWAKEQGLRLLWFKDSGSVFTGKDESVMMAVACIECATAVAFIFAVMWLTGQQRETIQAIDVSNITLSDYSLKVDYLPSSGISPEEVGQCFAQFGRVNMVVLGTDVSGVIGQHTSRAKWLRKREVLDAAFAKSGGKSAALRRAINYQVRRIEKLEAILNQKMESRPSLYTSAFVTFETELAKDKATEAYKPGSLIAWAMRPEKLRMRGTHRLWVRRAPEASDILWENLGIVGWNASIRRILAWVFTLIVLVCTGAMVVIAKSSANNVPPSISCTPPEKAGTLTCGAMWPAATTSGDASKAILEELRAFNTQVNAETCTSYVDGGMWKGNSAAYAPYTRPNALYDVTTGVWTGGFNASTVEDECSAMACFDCMCKEKFFKSMYVAIGLSSDDDGWWELCQDFFVSKTVEVCAAAFTACTNIVLALTTRAFSRLERHHTKSALEASVSTKLFLSLTINSAVIPLLVYAQVDGLKWIPYLFKGPFTDFSVGWYQSVGSLICITLAANALIYPLTPMIRSIARRTYRHVFAGYALTQRGLNEMFEGSEFRLSERYAQLMSMIFTSLMFSAGMPLLVPLAACFCYVVYNEAKLTLIRHCKKPPEYDEAMAELFSRIVPWASVMKLLLAGWMLSYVSVPTYKYSISTLDDALEPTEMGRQFDLNERLDRTNAAAPVVTLVLMLLAYYLKVNKMAIQSFISRYFSVKVFSEEEFSMTPDLSVAQSDGIIKGLKTYMVHDNPVYHNIVPVTATLCAGGAHSPMPAGWEGANDDGPSDFPVNDAGGSVEVIGMTARAEDAGSMPAGMQRMIKTSRESETNWLDDGGRGNDTMPEARRKPAVVTALTAPSFKKGEEQVTDFGDDFYGDEVEAINFDEQPADGLAAAMAMQPEGASRATSRADSVTDGSLQESKEERRRRRKEKKGGERKKRNSSSEGGGL